MLSGSYHAGVAFNAEYQLLKTRQYVQVDDGPAAGWLWSKGISSEYIEMWVHEIRLIAVFAAQTIRYLRDGRANATYQDWNSGRRRRSLARSASVDRDFSIRDQSIVKDALKTMHASSYWRWCFSAFWWLGPRSRLTQNGLDLLYHSRQRCKVQPELAPGEKNVWIAPSQSHWGNYQPLSSLKIMALALKKIFSNFFDKDLLSKWT